MIKGGYILQPRIIDEGSISNYPPHVREIWGYLLRHSNYIDKNINGTIIKRGQIFTSYKEIIDGLCWYVGYRKEGYKKHHCETAMKVLTKERMITTAKTTRGIIITICNYDYYQNPKNYENDRDTYNETTTKPQTTDTIHKKDNNQEQKEYIDTGNSQYDNFNKWLNENCTNIRKLKKQITLIEFNNLILKYKYQDIIEILEAMENKADLAKKYISVYLTANQWLKNKYKDQNNSPVTL